MGNSSSKKKSKGKSKPSVAFPGDTAHAVWENEEYRKNLKVSKKKKLSRKRIKCFLDISIDGASAGRLVIELRSDINPRTAENFRALCCGEMGVGYKGCKFHRIVPGYIVQSGDVDYKGTAKEGRGGRSVFGPTFADEDLDKLLHDKAGVLSMANKGPHTNGSQFMIIVDEEGCDWLNGLHTVFGQVVPESMAVLKKIEDCGQEFYRGDQKRVRITNNCVIEDCGQLKSK